MRRLLAVFALLSSARLASAATQRAYPINISEHLMLTVKVSADGLPPADFILDTGAGLHMLPMATIRKLDAKPLGRFT
jgi:hypothetical protein